jgi:hypothetical protein
LELSIRRYKELKEDKLWKEILLSGY